MLVLEEREIAMVYLVMVQLHQVEMVVQCVIIIQLGLDMMLVPMIVFQLIMVATIEVTPMMLDRIPDVITTTDAIMAMALNMMHQCMVVNRQELAIIRIYILIVDLMDTVQVGKRIALKRS